MPTMYVRNVPRDLFRRMKRLKEYMDTRTWISFFYEMERILREHFEEERETRLRAKLT